jgi:hypothetical protein
MEEASFHPTKLHICPNCYLSEALKNWLDAFMGRRFRRGNVVSETQCMSVSSRTCGFEQSWSVKKMPYWMRVTTFKGKGRSRENVEIVV